MTIEFQGTPQRSGNWTWLKPLFSSKSLVPQFEEDDSTYTVYGYDPPEALSCVIWKGTVPPSVAETYSQVQNDADKADFEANFKPFCNRSIDDIPSKVIATAVKSIIGNSANLAVNGSVTPVVFEYQAPNNYEVEITQLSLLFEASSAFGFGNVFVRTAIATLTNGLLLECKAADIAVNWQNMKRTRDIIEISKDFQIVTGTTNFMRANIHLPRSLRLARAGTYAQPDYLRLTVRDNLTSFTFAECFFQGSKI
jgi:hypothetical protein